MTIAVLLGGPGPGPVEPAPTTLNALRTAGVGDIRTDLDGDLAGQLRSLAELARSASEPLLLYGADVVAHDSVLTTVATEPGGGSVALVGAGPGSTRDGCAAVREERGILVAATAGDPATAAGGSAAGSDGTAGGAPATGRFLGVLRVGVADLAVLARCAERLAGTDDVAGRVPVVRAAPPAAEAGAPEASVAAPPVAAAVTGAGAVDGLLAGLVASGVRVAACRLRLLVADRAADRAEADAIRRRMAGVDEDKARLKLAVKERDDFFTTFFVSPLSVWVVRWAARVGLGPTAVTGISVALALVAAGCFIWGTRPGLVAGGVLLYVSFLLDCVDGQLARYTRQFSAFGGWLDTMADRSKEYVVYAALAIGAERTGLGTVWPLALAAIVLQTVRHMTDTWYGALHDQAAARKTGPGAGAGEVGGALGRVSERVQSDTGSVAYWLKRIVVFPIGERWALIALTAAVFDGRVALLVVLGWGALAAAYTLALRSLRARAMRVPVLSTVDTARHRDDGPLVRLFAGTPTGRRMPWPLPLAAAAALAAAVLLVAVGTGRAGGTPAVVLAGLAVVVLGGLPAGARHDGALDWLVPAALRAAEYLFVLGVGVAGDVPAPLVYALLLALALRHYDLTARLEKRAAAAPSRWWDAGWEDRVAVLVLGAALDLTAATVAVLTSYVVVMFCLGVVGAWAGGRSSVGHRTGGPAR